jgi:hypothetical protein
MKAFYLKYEDDSNNWAEAQLKEHFGELLTRMQAESLLAGTERTLEEFYGACSPEQLELISERTVEARTISEFVNEQMQEYLDQYLEESIAQLQRFIENEKYVLVGVGVSIINEDYETRADTALIDGESFFQHIDWDEVREPCFGHPYQKAWNFGYGDRLFYLTNETTVKS